MDVKFLELPALYWASSALNNFGKFAQQNEVSEKS